MDAVVVVRYQTKLERADENQALIERVLPNSMKCVLTHSAMRASD